MPTPVTELRRKAGYPYLFRISLGLPVAVVLLAFVALNRDTGDMQPPGKQAAEPLREILHRTGVVALLAADRAGPGSGAQIRRELAALGNYVAALHGPEGKAGRSRAFEGLVRDFDLAARKHVEKTGQRDQALRLLNDQLQLTAGIVEEARTDIAARKARLLAALAEPEEADGVPPADRVGIANRLSVDEKLAAQLTVIAGALRGLPEAPSRFRLDQARTRVSGALGALLRDAPGGAVPASGKLMASVVPRIVGDLNDPDRLFSRAAMAIGFQEGMRKTANRVATLAAEVEKEGETLLLRKVAGPVSQPGAGRHDPVLLLIVGAAIAHIGLVLVYRARLRRRLPQAPDRGKALRGVGDMLDSLPAGVIVWGPDREMVHFNRSCAELRPELTGLLEDRAPLPEFALGAGVIAQPDAPAGEIEAAASWADAPFSEDIEEPSPGKRIRRKVGRTEQGWTVLAFEDVSGERDAKEGRSGNAAELGGSACPASNDPQDPLRIVGSYCDMIERCYADGRDDGGGDSIAGMFDGVRRTRGLIDGLLAYYRAGRDDFSVKVFDLTDAVDRARRSLETPIRRSGADFSYADLPRIVGNEILIGQVFRNLFANAIKFASGEPPRIRISAGRIGADWVVSVEDNGIGIDEEEHDRIFRPFRRLHAGREYPGYGLGLALCKKIVTRHGGQIRAETDRPAGTEIRFSIPVFPAQYAESSDKEEARE